jgi:hypothetical protein
VTPERLVIGAAVAFGEAVALVLGAALRGRFGWPGVLIAAGGAAALGVLLIHRGAAAEERGMRGPRRRR